MNFLAHFHLAWPVDGLLAGGLEGDYYKGPLKGELPHSIEQGVKLHRSIDAYTDAHPLIRQLCREFPPELRRYAGILIDLSFDHYLSLHWGKYSPLELKTFNESVYGSLHTQRASLSDAANRMLQRIIDYDILGLYGDWETVPASAARIGERFKRHNPFEEVDSHLTPVKLRLEEVFLQFYPQLQDFAAQTKGQLN